MTLGSAGGISWALALCVLGAADALQQVPTFETVREWQLAGLFDTDGNFLSSPTASNGTGSSGVPAVSDDPYQTCASGSRTNPGGDALDTAQCVALTIDLLGKPTHSLWCVSSCGVGALVTRLVLLARI